MPQGQLLQNHILRDVGVLELIDQDIPKAIPVPVAERLIRLEQSCGLHEQIIEIQAVILAQTFLIRHVGTYDNLVIVRAHRVMLRREELVLGS